jgi:hypothetical protein
MVFPMSRIGIRMDPHNFGKPDPDPRQSLKSGAVEAYYGNGAVDSLKVSG